MREPNPQEDTKVLIQKNNNNLISDQVNSETIPKENILELISKLNSETMPEELKEQTVGSIIILLALKEIKNQLDRFNEFEESTNHKIRNTLNNYELLLHQLNEEE